MAPQTFAEALKAARKAAGLSQAALARRAGVTGSYISVLESGRRRAPPPRVVKALAKALGTKEAPLQDAAALERSPAPVRRRLERMRKERGKVQRSRDRLLTTTLFHLARGPRVVDPMAHFLDLPPGQAAMLGRLLGRVRKVRSVNEAESKSADLLKEVSPDDRDALVRVLPRALVDPTPDAPPTAHPVSPDASPADAASEEPAFVDEDPPYVDPEPYDDDDREDTHDDAFPEGDGGPAPSSPPPVPIRGRLSRGARAVGELHVDPELFHEDAFFWRVPDDAGHPRIEAGDLLLVDPSRTPREGDLVVLRHAGKDLAGVVRSRGDEVQVVFPRPEVPPVRIARARFRPVGVVTWQVRDLR